MLLAIDIGNTNIVVGVYRERALAASFRASTVRRETSDEIGLFISGQLARAGVANGDITKVIISSVVPPLTPVFERMAAEYFHCQPLVVTARLKLPVRVEIDKPDEVGADRIANAAAVYVKFGGPAIVVDIGTATTFDVVSRDGAYIGGVIMPGPETAMSSLARRAARLFEVRFEPPDRVVGKSTAGALKSGLFHGLVGQVDYLIEKIIAECGFEGCTVIATGGLAAGIEKHSRYIKQVDPNLTLEGLRLIAEGN